MKHKLQTLAFMALMTIFVGAVSVAGQAPPQMAPVPPERPFRADPIQQLNLTPEQREQIRVIREENRDERSTINQRVRDANRALEQVLDTDNPNESVVEERVREAAAAQAAAMRMRIMSEVKIRRVLSQEQRVLLRALRRQALEARGERRQENLERRQQRREDGSLRLRERRRNRAPLFPRADPPRRPPL